MGINLKISIIGIISAMLLTVVTSVTLSGQAVGAKTESYQLTVYLDNAFMPNHRPSFKIIIYDSDHKEILSEKVTPDFTDTHQVISPVSGYKIADKSKQHPNEIKVCAQETYLESGKTNVHDDCFPIQQDNAKTQWYATFDYPLIEEFEVNEDEGT